MGIRFLLFFFLFSLPGIMCKELPDVTIIVHGSALAAETNDEFVCATIDWWPPQKCNYNQCPWGKASVFNLVKVRDGGTDWGWGVVVNVVKKPGTALASGVTPSVVPITLLILCYIVLLA
ncbi:DExH-box ATP-dependent RNA helicase DExH10 [Iris pallida]|uniref:DExH-box ATP-dependent RNA helicase DExH10 n=1 Tax=Iris pallida TaxID=29817 RepID=A0AAX6HAV2_IRIPA|nr:DExH-box ATP-dependent RNA helicase DExH10 [Iris pallida]